MYSKKYYLQLEIFEYINAMTLHPLVLRLREYKINKVKKLEKLSKREIKVDD